MVLAEKPLIRKEVGVAEVAQRVGYASASASSVAFTRHVGLPPIRYAREQIESLASQPFPLQLRIRVKARF